MNSRDLPSTLKELQTIIEKRDIKDICIPITKHQDISNILRRIKEHFDVSYFPNYIFELPDLPSPD